MLQQNRLSHQLGITSTYRNILSYLETLLKFEKTKKTLKLVQNIDTQI